jgi:amino acid transporter
VAVVVGVVFGTTLGVAIPAFAATATDKVTEGIDNVGGKDNTVPLDTFIANIINILLFVIGAVAVIMIIIGGIRYVTSNGDQAQVKGAKDTILYSIIGLVVAILAYAIVNFVVLKLI